MTDKSNHPIIDTHRILTEANRDRLLLSITARKQALRHLQKALIGNEERIFRALKTDLNRARFETYVTEIAIIKEEINLALTSLRTWSRRRVVKTPLTFQPGTSYVEPTPKGVVLIIAPWNYPFQLSLVPLVSAIAAGNCAIVKPSEFAPASASVIADIINNHLENRCFRAILGDTTTAQSLLDLPFDHIFYTGSSTIGTEVMKKAAVHLTPVTLELGGKSPCIVDASADLKLAVKRILWGKYMNAGQTCIAPDYVLIDRKLINDFVMFAKTHLLAMYGDQVEKSESYGRIINQQHFTRLVSYLGEGLVAHGGRHDAATKFLEPTILLDVKADAAVMTDEIFGPILPIIGINVLDEAISFINRKAKPLAIYVFSNNSRHIEKVIEETISGGIAINDCVSQAGIIGLPFGGVGHSGFGAYHGVYGFETFSHMRAVHKRANILDNAIKYAPYSDKKLKLARILL